MADATQIFAEIDLDDDGYISVTELKEYLNRTRSTSDAASSRYFGLLDKNKDDQISFEEFEKSYLAGR
ncbi:EF-hand domain pair [Nocardia amikacinitolerans]|uniref:EF-hand domain pair n=1 Tax=Nocardia amikacinitolerans TaxID=756689 RepID=A0A285LR80_9NOCA|nr:EF-hand domain-containing protein [Nocardia amikacinitolerans]MCP2295004.1 EF-hand domain pair [Nocardia amikacinitolerans]SNY87432.1 EF-hand domain pair [Nocardia amikacinitolerans]